MRHKEFYAKPNAIWAFLALNELSSILHSFLFFLYKKGKTYDTCVINIVLIKNTKMWHELTNGVLAEPKKETSTIALLQKFIDKLISHLFVFLFW